MDCPVRLGPAHRLSLQVDGGSELVACVDSLVTELLLDAQNLVQLGQTL